MLTFTSHVTIRDPFRDWEEGVWHRAGYVMNNMIVTLVCIDEGRNFQRSALSILTSQILYFNDTSDPYIEANLTFDATSTWF
jgi:hypothetical protein